VTAAATTSATAAATAVTATTTATATTPTSCQYQVSGEVRLVLLVEHIERRQADVRDFLFAENDLRPRILSG
jgi:hypothetical protein